MLVGFLYGIFTEDEDCRREKPNAEFRDTWRKPLLFESSVVLRVKCPVGFKKKFFCFLVFVRSMRRFALTTARIGTTIQYKFPDRVVYVSFSIRAMTNHIL